MKLKVLDLRENDFRTPNLVTAKNFLRETVVFLKNKKILKNREEEYMNSIQEYAPNKEDIIKLNGYNPLVIVEENEEQLELI